MKRIDQDLVDTIKQIKEEHSHDFLRQVAKEDKVKLDVLLEKLLNKIAVQQYKEAFDPEVSSNYIESIRDLDWMLGVHGAGIEILKSPDFKRSGKDGDEATVLLQDMYDYYLNKYGCEYFAEGAVIFNDLFRTVLEVPAFIDQFIDRELMDKRHRYYFMIYCEKRNFEYLDFVEEEWMSLIGVNKDVVVLQTSLDESKLKTLFSDLCRLKFVNDEDSDKWLAIWDPKKKYLGPVRWKKTQISLALLIDELAGQNFEHRWEKAKNCFLVKGKDTIDPNTFSGYSSKGFGDGPDCSMLRRVLEKHINH